MMREKPQARPANEVTRQSAPASIHSSAFLRNGRGAGDNLSGVEARRPIVQAGAGRPSNFAAVPAFLADSPTSVRSSPIVLQKKLAIGRTDDPLEHEADRVADQVMRMPDPAVSVAGAPPQVSRKFQKRAAGPEVGAAPTTVHEVLSSPGRPLERDTRASMEARFGRDFSHVRVHTSAAADQSARDINAKAYTAGNSIVFGAGQYAPATNSGQRLIAHELTHVAQQSADGGVFSTKQVSNEPINNEKNNVEGADRFVNRVHGIGRPFAASGLVQREISGPEELAGAAKKWLGDKYSSGKEAVYKGLISGLRKFQKSTFDALRAQASKLPTSMQPASLTIINVLEEIAGVLITLILAIVGIVVGFGEGIVDLIEGLVRLVWGIVKWFGFLVLGFFDHGQKFEQYNKEIIASVKNIPDGLRSIVRDWLDKFEKAPIDRGSLMIGELTGQLIAFIASFGLAASKVGMVPKLTGAFRVIASGGRLSLFAVESAAPVAAGAAAAGGLISPIIMHAADSGAPKPTSQPDAPERGAKLPAEVKERGKDILDVFEEGQKKADPAALEKEFTGEHGRGERDKPGGGKTPRRYEVGNFCHDYAEELIPELKTRGELDREFKIPESKRRIDRVDWKDGTLIEVKPNVEPWMTQGNEQLRLYKMHMDAKFPRPGGWKTKLATYDRDAVYRVLEHGWPK